MNDLNIRPDGKVVPLPEFVPVICKPCGGSGVKIRADIMTVAGPLHIDCPDCRGFGSVLINKERLKVVNA